MQKFYTLGARTGKLFDILIVFLKAILEKVNFEKSQQMATKASYQQTTITTGRQGDKSDHLNLKLLMLYYSKNFEYFSFCYQIKCWLSWLEFTKCLSE